MSSYNIALDQVTGQKLVGVAVSVVANADGSISSVPVPQSGFIYSVEYIPGSPAPSSLTCNVQSLRGTQLLGMAAMASGMQSLTNQYYNPAPGGCNLAFSTNTTPYAQFTLVLGMVL